MPGALILATGLMFNYLFINFYGGMYNDFLENIFYKKKLVPPSFLNGTNFYGF